MMKNVVEVWVRFFWVFPVLVSIGCSSGRDLELSNRRRIYEAEELKIPKEIVVDSIALDGVGLSVRGIYDLLVNKRISLVEIIPSRVEGDKNLTRLAWDSEYKSWLYPVATYMFVQLRISSIGDSSCMKREDLPHEIRYLISQSPMHPNACLSMRISAKSDARFKLSYSSYQDGVSSVGRWQLIDASNGGVVSSLTTADNPRVPRRVSEQDPNEFFLAPYSTLVRRLRGPHMQRVPPYLIYTYDNVKASTLPPVEYERYGEVLGRQSLVFYSSNEPAKVHTQFESNTWGEVIRQAEATGFSYIGGQVVEQASGRIVSLQGRDVNIYPFPLAADRGFFVFGEPYSSNKRNHLLSFYRLDGSLAWTVRLRIEGDELMSGSRGFYPYAAGATADEIYFEQQCGNRNNVGDDRVRVCRVSINRAHLMKVLARSD